MVNFLPIVKTLETINISVRGLGQVVVDPATIVVGNNSVVARCRIDGARGWRAIKCYTTSQYCGDESIDSLYPQSLMVYTFSGRKEYVDVSIGKWIDGDALDVVLYRGGCDFVVLSRTFDRMALRHLQRGVVHCDIKPENIIVKPNGEMVLIDSSTGSSYGTEQFRHRHRSLRRTDKYTDHYPLALISTMLAALTYEPHFLDVARPTEEYIADAMRILRDNDDVGHYNIIVAMQNSVMGKIKGIEELFKSVVVADE